MIEKKEQQETQVQKPLSMAINDLKKDIAYSINQSQLPVYISQMILKDLLNDISSVSEEICSIERKNYLDSIKEEQIQND